MTGAYLCSQISLSEAGVHTSQIGKAFTDLSQIGKDQGRTHAEGPLRGEPPRTNIEAPTRRPECVEDDF